MAKPISATRHLSGSLLVFGALLLGACSSPQHQDLQEYVDQVKDRPKGRISPLPEIRRYETFAYAAQDLRDPFLATFMVEQDRVNDNGLRPDRNRKKEALEAFSLDSLELVGHLERQDEHWALVSDPEGMVHRVQEGNYLGQNYGEILTISESRVDIREIVPDGMGGWMERSAALTLTETE